MIENLELKFVVSYFNVGTFGVNSCGRTTPNVFQIVIFESTGLIDILVGNKTCRSTTNDSKAIMGIQNWRKNICEYNEKQREKSIK